MAPKSFLGLTLLAAALGLVTAEHYIPPAPAGECPDGTISGFDFVYSLAYYEEDSAELYAGWENICIGAAETSVSGPISTYRTAASNLASHLNCKPKVFSFPNHVNFAFMYAMDMIIDYYPEIFDFDGSEDGDIERPYGLVVDVRGEELSDYNENKLTFYDKYGTAIPMSFFNDDTTDMEDTSAQAYVGISGPNYNLNFLRGAYPLNQPCLSFLTNTVSDDGGSFDFISLDNTYQSNECDQFAYLYYYDNSDLDSDGTADVCDTDRDGDEVLNGADFCPDSYDPSNADDDSDGHGDLCDTCPGTANPGVMPATVAAACPEEWATYRSIESLLDDGEGEESPFSLNAEGDVEGSNGFDFYYHDDEVIYGAGIANLNDFEDCDYDENCLGAFIMPFKTAFHNNDYWRGDNAALRQYFLDYYSPLYMGYDSITQFVFDEGFELKSSFQPYEGIVEDYMMGYIGKGFVTFQGASFSGPNYWDSFPNMDTDFPMISGPSAYIAALQVPGMEFYVDEDSYARIWYNGTSPHRSMIIEWSDVDYYGPYVGDIGDFQIVMLEHPVPAGEPIVMARYSSTGFSTEDIDSDGITIAAGIVNQYGDDSLDLGASTEITAGGCWAVEGVATAGVPQAHLPDQDSDGVDDWCDQCDNLGQCTIYGAEGLYEAGADVPAGATCQTAIPISQINEEFLVDWTTNRARYSPGCWPELWFSYDASTEGELRFNYCPGEEAGNDHRPADVNISVFTVDDAGNCPQTDQDVTFCQSGLVASCPTYEAPEPLEPMNLFYYKKRDVNSKGISASEIAEKNEATAEEERQIFTSSNVVNVASGNRYLIRLSASSGNQGANFASNFLDGTFSVDGPPTALTGGVCCDPHFVGFDDQLYNVQGDHGKFYSLLSDSAAGVEMNAEFTSPGCPGREDKTVIGMFGMSYAGRQIYFHGTGRAELDGELILEENVPFQLTKPEDSASGEFDYVMVSRHPLRDTHRLHIVTRDYKVVLDSKRTRCGTSRVDFAVERVNLHSLERNAVSGLLGDSMMAEAFAERLPETQAAPGSRPELSAAGYERQSLFETQKEARDANPLVGAGLVKAEAEPLRKVSTVSMGDLKHGMRF